jgi:hypothetical protein
MAITVIGLDPAKNVFQVHGIDEFGGVVLRRKLRRSAVLALLACQIARELGVARDTVRKTNVAVGDTQAAHDHVERVLTMAWNGRS